VVNATLVTIHGFWSSPITWQPLNAIWQADERLRGLQIDPFGYPSPKKPHLPFSATRVPDYDDVAQNLATWYTVRLAKEPGVAIVTHSQGGLILQRFLTWMLHEGRGRELARIRTIVMLACPNGGSEYLRSVRHILRFGRHAQAGSLEVLDKHVANTQRTVLQRIVNATGVDDYQCRIPFHVYAGDSDKIVTAASAQGAFPGASALAGNHFSILDPAAPGNCTAETVKYHLLTDLAASAVQPGEQILSTPEAPPGSGSASSAAEARDTGRKFTVDIRDSQGVIVGDHANITQSFWKSQTRPPKPDTEGKASEAGDCD
jgi:pimeloyl-ACP methyl ester carboxylesterase